MRERFETKSKSNLLKEIEDILADASQSELSSIKESIMNRNSMRTEKTQIEEPGSTQSTVSTTMLNQNVDRVPSGKTIDSRSKSTFQPRPLINDDEEEAKLSSNQSIASSKKGGIRLSTPSSTKDQPSTQRGKNLDSHGFSSNQSRPLINDDKEEAKLSSNQSIASSEKGGTRLSTPLSMTDQQSTLINGDEEEAQLPSHQGEEAQMSSHQSTKSSDKGEARLSPRQ